MYIPDEKLSPPHTKTNLDDKLDLMLQCAEIPMNRGR
jgi:hypothetical protein